MIDDLSTGRLDNLAAVAGDPKLHVHEADVAAPAAPSGLIEPGDVD